LLAEIYRARRDYELTEKAIKEAMQVGGDKAILGAALGRLHYNQGDLQKPLKIFEYLRRNQRIQTG
jgi:hypothetical protein